MNVKMIKVAAMAFAASAGLLLGCRRTDVRDFEVSIPALTAESEPAIRQSLAGFAGVEKSSLKFDRAAKKFNDADVDVVITQHLAYSPSLESIDALLSIKAPLIVLDTTPDYELLSKAGYYSGISNIILCYNNKVVLSFPKTFDCCFKICID